MIESIFDCSVFKGYDLPLAVSYNKTSNKIADRVVRSGYNSILQSAYSILESKYLKPYFALFLNLNELYHFHVDTAGFYLNDSNAESLVIIRELLQQDPLFGKNCLVSLFGNYYQYTEEAMSFYTDINNIKLFGECIRHIPYGGYGAKNILRAGGISATHAYGPFAKFIRSTTNFYYKGNLINWLIGRFRGSMIDGDIFLADVNSENNQRIRRVLNYSKMCRPAISHKPKHFFYNLMINYISLHRQWFEDGTYVNFKGVEIYVNHHTLFENRDMYNDFINHPEFPNQLPHGILPAVYFKKLIEKLARTSYGKYRKIHMAKLKTHLIEMRQSKYRQLTTGIEMVNEGVRMNHCVGGINYLEQLQNGETIFFHLDLSDCKHGATLSMETTSFVSEVGDTYVGPYGGLWTVDQYYGYDDRDLDSDLVAQAELRKFLVENFTVADKPEFTMTQKSDLDINHGYFGTWSSQVCDPDSSIFVEPGIQIESPNRGNRITANLLNVNKDEHGILNVAIGFVGKPGEPESTTSFSGRGMSNPTFSWVETFFTDHRLACHRYNFLSTFKSIRKRQIELLGSVALWSELDLVSDKYSLRSCKQSILLEAGTLIWSPKPVDIVRGNLPSYRVSIRCNGIHHENAFKIKAGESFKFTAEHQAILTFSPIHQTEHTELTYRIREIGV